MSEFCYAQPHSVAALFCCFLSKHPITPDKKPKVCHFYIFDNVDEMFRLRMRTLLGGATVPQGGFRSPTLNMTNIGGFCRENYPQSLILQTFQLPLPTVFFHIFHFYSRMHSRIYCICNNICQPVYNHVNLFRRYKHIFLIWRKKFTYKLIFFLVFKG